MSIIEKISGILKFPSGYRLFQSMVGAEYSRKLFLSEYVKLVPNEKVLDIGCGPAEILAYLPAVQYTGIDLSPEYIEAAKQRFGNRGRFCRGDVGLATLEGEHGTFDAVLSMGVLHHLDNKQAAKLFALARRALRPGGRLVTSDGCYVPDQSPVARWLLSKDRGRFVRPPDEYQQLALAHFSSVTSCIRHDLLRIPYTHLIMICQ